MKQISDELYNAIIHDLKKADRELKYAKPENMQFYINNTRQIFQSIVTLLEESETVS